MRAALLTVDKGEVSFNSSKTKVKGVVSLEEQRRVLKACHSEPTSDHFGVIRRTREWHTFQRKSSGGSIFIKKILPAHDLEGSKFCSEIGSLSIFL